MNPSASTLEITSFRTKPGVSEAQLRSAIVASNLYLNRCPGFLGRHIGREPGTGLWREVLEWRDLDCAEAGAAHFLDAPEASAFADCIDFGAADNKLIHVDLVADYEAESLVLSHV